ncbi:hypothetical protein AC249_AIPGENE3864 [Exaiptasia diaphana]|nr:hypothetical protein AC249_AIPGENE3864 [Exaiptasia diaphana]
MDDPDISLANLSNNSSVYRYCKYWKPDTDLESYAKLSALAILAVSGILLNVFVIVLAAKYTERKNLHYLIINMALSDALYLLARFSPYAIWEFNYKWRIFPAGTWGDIVFNSWFSPCIYIIFLTDFRKAARKVLCRNVNTMRRYSIELQPATLATSATQSNLCNLTSQETSATSATNATSTTQSNLCNLTSQATSATSATNATSATSATRNIHINSVQPVAAMQNETTRATRAASASPCSKN